MKFFLIKQFDALVYGFVGPFAVAYIFPEFFKNLESKLNINIQNIDSFNYLGVVLLNLGGVLAIWCTIIMYISKKASPSPFTLPKKVITTGPFRYVRHPMMWALHFVILGQIFVNCSPFILIWFLIWLRFAFMYIDKYEEPYLISLFGDEYIEYCKSTPRWFPLKKNK